jgi:hypothetical protein
MKSTVVPAQITTVEDKIAGNLSVTQLMLLIAPVMLTGLLFTIAPPTLQLTAYKLVIASLFGMTCLLLAVRVKGTLLLHWLITISRYNLRAQIHVLNKNDSYLRYIEVPFADLPETLVEDAVVELRSPSLKQLAIGELVRLEAAIEDPRAKFQLLVKKGGLHVSIHEIKEDSL